MAVAGELPQVERAETGAVAEPGGRFGGGDGPDFRQQGQQGGTDLVLTQSVVVAGPAGQGVEVVFSHFAKSATLQSVWQVAAGR